MLYADNEGVVSQSPEQPRKMMGVIVVVCTTFDLTVSEAMAANMCLRTKGMPEATAIFGVEAVCQVYNQAKRLYTSEKCQRKCQPANRGQPAHTQRMVQLPEVHPRTVRPNARFPRAQTSDVKSRGTPHNVVRLRHVEPARVPSRYAAPSPPQHPD